MDNFTPIRNGLSDHIRAGKLCPFDLGVYVFLHLQADWATGIYHGCALGIAHGFNDPSLKEHIQKSLRRLRDRQYINYPKGEGKRGGYPILINKYEVTVGELSGHRLNAWKHGELCQPEYVAQNGRGTVVAQSRNSDGTVVAPNQDLLDIQDVTKPKRNALALPDWLPLDAWQGYVEMRKRIRHPLTERAKAIELKKLSELREQGEDPAAVLDQSTAKAWRGLFEVKGKQHDNRNVQVSEDDAAELGFDVVQSS